MWGSRVARRMEIDAHAAAMCREDQRGEVGYGEGSGGYWARRARLRGGVGALWQVFARILQAGQSAARNRILGGAVQRKMAEKQRNSSVGSFLGKIRRL
jgi:hypothetical protein